MTQEQIRELQQLRDALAAQGVEVEVSVLNEDGAGEIQVKSKFDDGTRDLFKTDFERAQGYLADNLKKLGGNPGPTMKETTCSRI